MSDSQDSKGAPMSDTQEPAKPVSAPDESAPKKEQTLCLRCRRVVPVDDDGFCEPCLKEIDRACL